MVKTISVKKYHGVQPGSVRGSLAAKGLTRFPGAKVRIPPHLEPNGEYRTGLDENALYISQIEDEKEREAEKAHVRSLYALAKKLYGERMDLSPTSDFYTRMTDSKMGTMERCPFAELEDKDNIFNISQVKEELITYAYLRVHPNIAPSAKALLDGRWAHCKYYVNDTEVEDEESYNNKKEINKAIVTLDSLSESKQRKIARQLGIPVTEAYTALAVYNHLDNFIKNSNKTEGKYNATRFLKIASIKDDNLDVMDLVKEALIYNILKRDSKTGKIKFGNVHFANSEEDAITKLSDIANNDDLIALKEQLAIKKNTAK